MPSINDFYLGLGIDFDEKALKRYEKHLKGIDKGVKNAEKSTKKLGEETVSTATKADMSLGKLFNIGKKTALGIAGVGTAAVYAGAKIADSNVELGNLAEQTGFSLEQIQRFRRQVELMGGDLSEADGFASSFSKKIAELMVQGGEAGRFSLELFGRGDVDLNDLDQIMARLREFYQTADINRQRLATAEFGLTPSTVALLATSEDSFKEINRLANETEFLSKQDVENAREFDRTWGNLKIKTKAFANNIFSGLFALKKSAEETKKIEANLTKKEKQESRELNPYYVTPSKLAKGYEYLKRGVSQHFNPETRGLNVPNPMELLDASSLIGQGYSNLQNTYNNRTANVTNNININETGSAKDTGKAVIDAIANTEEGVIN